MGKSGISKEVWDGQEEPQGFKVCPPGVNLEFEITDTNEDHTDRGKRGPHDFVQAVCTTHGDDGEKYDHWEYMALTKVSDGLGYAKKFLTGIGREDAFDENFNWEDLKGTVFTADVSNEPDQSRPGKMRSRLDYDTLAFEVDEEAAETPADKAGSKPKRPPRRR
jgi:hypothetical protein